MTWVAAGIASGAATMAGVQYIKGKRDQKKDEANRPVYNIPDEVKQNLTDAEIMALEGMPAEQKQAYLSNLERGTAFGLSQMGTRKAGLTGLATLNEQQNQGYQGMLAMDSAQRMQNKGVVMQQRQNMADYKDQAFQFNTIDPYYEGIARKQARTGALFQNLNNAASMGMGGMGGGGGKSQQGGGGGAQQYGQVGREGNMYNYNPYSNQQGVVPDGGMNYGDIG